MRILNTYIKLKGGIRGLNLTSLHSLILHSRYTCQKLVVHYLNLVNLYLIGIQRGVG